MKVVRTEKEPQVRERTRQISMFGTRRMRELRLMRRRRFSQHITYVLYRVSESRWDPDLWLAPGCRPNSGAAPQRPQVWHFAASP